MNRKELEELKERLELRQLLKSDFDDILDLVKKYEKIEDSVLNWSISHYHTYDYMRLIQDVIENGD